MHVFWEYRARVQHWDFAFVVDSAEFVYGLRLL